MFTTALYSLKSPQNLGMIARTHVALGGDMLVDVVDGEKPWTWNQRSVYWSRGVHKSVDLKSFTDFDAFVRWAHEERKQEIVAVEISESAVMLPDFQFPDHPILLLGNETVGIPREMLARCDHVVVIPHFGPIVGSLNVSNAAAIVMYEAVRSKGSQCRPIEGAVFSSPQSSKEERRRLLSSRSSSSHESPGNDDGFDQDDDEDDDDLNTVPLFD